MKLGRLEGADEVPAFDQEAFEVYEHANGSRCVLARSSSNPIGLIRHLLGKVDGEVALLYVLLLSRKQANLEGRHQSPWVRVTQADEFLRRFGEFLQGDGRHELWLFAPDFLQVVYDHHERIWVYGQVNSIVEWVEEFGIAYGVVEPIPVPHSHHYHAHFDDEEDEIMRHWEWSTSLLQPRDGE